MVIVVSALTLAIDGSKMTAEGEGLAICQDQ